MRLPFGTDEDLDRLFEGATADDRTRDLALFFADVKDAAIAMPAAERATRHVAALSAEATRLAPVPVAVGGAVVVELALWRRMMDKNLPRLGKAVAGVMAASMSMIGLAYAGVDLPGTAAERALEAVSGLELPNQGEPETGGKSVSDAVKAVVESDAEKGCAFGQAVAAAASQNRQGQGGADTDPCAAGDSDGGQPQGSRATGEEASAEGRAKAAAHNGGASDAGSGNASDGTSTAGEHSGGASDGGASNSAGGRATGEEQSGGAGDGALGGPGTGTETSAEGRANAPVEVPPGH